MAVNKDMTDKLKNYFHKTGLYKVEKLTNRQQRQVVQDVGCSSIQLVEFVLFNAVTTLESEED
jgi:hypothetical protein